MAVSGTIALIGSALLLGSVVLATAWYVRLQDVHRAMERYLAAVQEQLNSNSIAVLPLRIFIGIGWLRASAEKIGDREWWSGVTLSGFLNDHVARGAIVFPEYRVLVERVFLPSVLVLAAVIAIGQLLVGIGILSGTFTNAALFGALFMNVNFLLAGQPNPNAFYIVIQVAILVTGAGGIFGLDRWLVKSHPRNPLIARPDVRWNVDPLTCISMILLALAVGIYALDHVSDTSAGGSVADPAVVLVVLCGMTIIWLTLLLARSIVGAPSEIHQSSIVRQVVRAGDRTASRRQE